MPQVPEDTFQPAYGASRQTFFAPNFVGGQGNINQPGVTTQPGEGDDDDDGAGPNRPKSRLGSVRANFAPIKPGGGGGKQFGKLSEQDISDLNNRGTAPPTVGNFAKLAGNVIGMTGPGIVQTGAASIAENATGAEPGEYGGFQNYDGWQPGNFNKFGVDQNQSVASMAEQASRETRGGGPMGAADRSEDSGPNVGGGFGDSGSMAAQAAHETKGQNTGTGADASSPYAGGGTVLPSATASYPAT
jgi:hypothetical protein